MTDLTVSPGALRAYAATQDQTAQQFLAHANGESADLARLAPTFGIIGAEFLAALGTALASRRTRIAAVAARHTAVAHSSRAGATTYAETDATAGARLGMRSGDEMEWQL